MSEMSADPWRRPALMAATGGLALALGLLVYLLDRSPTQAMLIPRIAALAGSRVFGVIGQWLPSFVHPFAFSLFTAAALAPRVGPRYEACVAWGAVNIAFELGQHPLLSGRVAEALQDALGRTPLTRSIANYFLRGTFDIGDIVAALAGALAAAVVLYLLHPRPEPEHAR
jgi:hypothetical protein